MNAAQTLNENCADAQSISALSVSDALTNVLMRFSPEALPLVLVHAGVVTVVAVLDQPDCDVLPKVIWNGDQPDCDVLANQLMYGLGQILIGLQMMNEKRQLLKQCL